MGRRKKAGRKHGVDTHRQPNGQPHRPAEPAITPETQARREALCNGDERMARTEAPGRASALLLCWGVLATPRQAEALERYRSAVMAYWSVAGIPPGAPRVANIAVMPDGAADPDDTDARRCRGLLTAAEERDRVRRIVSRAAEVYGIVGIGTLRRQIVDRIALDDVAPPRWQEGLYAPYIVGVLRRACDELADYFRIQRGA